jgi:hypothetical protein
MEAPERVGKWHEAETVRTPFWLEVQSGKLADLIVVGDFDLKAILIWSFASTGPRPRWRSTRWPWQEVEVARLGRSAPRESETSATISATVADLDPSSNRPDDSAIGLDRVSISAFREAAVPKSRRRLRCPNFWEFWSFRRQSIAPQRTSLDSGQPTATDCNALECRFPSRCCWSSAGWQASWTPCNADRHLEVVEVAEGATS